VITCNELEQVVADLALGMLSGDERADALAHMGTCAACRHAVEAASQAVDALGVLTPAAEPPAGFEERVLWRLDGEARHARRSRRAIVLAAAAVIALVVGATILLRPSREPAEVASFSMRTASGRVVGDAYLHRGDSTWVFVEVPGWTDDTTPHDYELRITADDGRTLTIPGGFRTGSGGWGTAIDIDALHVREIALVDTDGDVWCSARVTA